MVYTELMEDFFTVRYERFFPLHSIPFVVVMIVVAAVVAACGGAATKEPARRRLNYAACELKGERSRSRRSQPPGGRLRKSFTPLTIATMTNPTKNRGTTSSPFARSAA